MAQHNIAIGVPTISSGAYIYHSLERYLAECLFLDPAQYNFEIVVCLNGIPGTEFNSAQKEINRFISSHTEQNITLLINEAQGKNLALNNVLNYVRTKNITILHVLDDDVEIEPGSIFHNINALIKNRPSASGPLLSGSDFEARRLSLKQSIARQQGLYKGIIAWFLQQIFILPYSHIVPSPKFCSGQSFAAFVTDLPNFPKDGIADDAFISNYIAHINRDEIENNNINPIIKPEGSRIYFYVPGSLKEWTGSKLRNYVGITRASMFFEEDFDFLESYFAWPFSFLSAYRTTPKLNGLNAIKYSIYEMLLQKLEKQGQVFLDSGKNPDWATAKSTK